MRHRASEDLAPTGWTLAGEHHRSATWPIYPIAIPFVLVYGLICAMVTFVCVYFFELHVGLPVGVRRWTAVCAGFLALLFVGLRFLRSYWRRQTDCLVWDRGGLAYQCSCGHGVLPWEGIEWVGADDGQDGHKVAIEGRDPQTSSTVWLRIGVATLGESRWWPSWSNTGVGLITALENARSAALTSTSFAAPPPVPQRRPLPIRVVALWLVLQATLFFLMYRYPAATDRVFKTLST